MLYLSRTKWHKYINSGNFDIVIYQGYWSFFIILMTAPLSFASHAIIFLNIIVNAVELGKDVKKEKSLETWISLTGAIFMMLGAVVDLLRTYTIKVGDLGKAGRYGVCIYGICQKSGFQNGN